MELLLPYNALTTLITTTISSLTLKTGEKISSIYNHKNPDVTAFLRKLDIEAKLKIIEALMIQIFRETNPGDSISVTSKLENANDPVRISLYYLSIIINDIHIDLERISMKIVYHNGKWLNKWRTFNVKGDLEVLETNCHILDERYKNLIQICLVSK